MRRQSFLGGLVLALGLTFGKMAFAGELISQAEADLYKGLGGTGGGLSGATGGSTVGSGGNSGGGNTSSSNTSSPSSAFKLTGGITHAESLAPLPDWERPGALSNPATLSGPGALSNSATLSGPGAAGKPGALRKPGALSNPATLTRPEAVVGVPVQNQSFKALPQIDASTQNLDQARRNAALKSQAAKVDPSLAEYKKRMKAVIEQNLKSGAVTGAGAKPSTLRGGSQVKVRIPHWLAGQWLRQESEETSRVDLTTGKALKALGRQPARVLDVFGTYKDKNGQVWMTVPLNAAGSVDRGFALDCHRVKRYQIIETGKNSCVVKVQASHYVVEKSSRKILQAYQDEELNYYKLLRPGLVSTESSVKVFDDKGSARLLTRAVSTQKRVRNLF
ncbi:MAG: hypothetical protein HY986_17070 [Candidatus Melainabacteria bacterium]|nr:hypothetical protein [Candidatus Melainabacteria bacterium]